MDNCKITFSLGFLESSKQTMTCAEGVKHIKSWRSAWKGLEEPTSPRIRRAEIEKKVGPLSKIVKSYSDIPARQLQRIVECNINSKTSVQIESCNAASAFFKAVNKK